MYRKIIVGHDLRAGGDDALALGKLLATATHAELVVAGVFPFGVLPRGFSAEWRELETRCASRIQALADASGAQAEAFPSSSPARGLQELAQEIGADLVVVGSSRHSRVGELLAGNVGLGLLHGSPCAVALAPRDFRQRDGHLGTVIVGYDGSDESRLALEDGVSLARGADAMLKVVVVAEPPTLAYSGGGTSVDYGALKNAIEGQCREELEEALDMVPDGVKLEATLVGGAAAEKLADAGRAGGSLLILGSRAYGPVRRVALGSVAARLMRSAPCPIVVHPRGTRAEFAAAALADESTA